METSGYKIICLKIYAQNGYCYEGFICLKLTCFILFLWGLKTKYPFLGVYQKALPQLGNEPRTFCLQGDAIPTELSGLLRTRHQWCSNVLLDSNGLSPTCLVATPSDTQHTIFEIFLVPQCSICWPLLCLLVIVFCDRNNIMMPISSFTVFSQWLKAINEQNGMAS